MKRAVLAFLILILGSSDAYAFDVVPEFRVEIHRERDGVSDVVVRQFNDLDEVLMWFEKKVDDETCDPNAERVILFLNKDK